VWANRAVDVSLMILSWVVVPLQFVTTFVLGILVTISFGLLLIPLSLIWVILFMGPLLALSWLWHKVPFLRIPVGCCGIPIAVVGNTYCCLIPSMGEWESRFSKLALSETFPFTLDCWALIRGKRSISFEDPDNLDKIIFGFRRHNPTIYEYLINVPLRPGGYLYTPPPS
jgi:hypothetical protein